MVEDDVAKYVLVDARCTSQRSDHASFEARQDRARCRSKSCLMNQMVKVEPRVSVLRESERKRSRDSEAIQ